VGYPASVHDSRCISFSSFLETQKYLQDNEYVLADSAYSLSNTLITPYKKPLSQIKEYKNFNQILSSE
jgi:hypothetical protein